MNWQRPYWTRQQGRIQLRHRIECWWTNEWTEVQTDVARWKKIKTNTEKDRGFYFLYVWSMLLCVLPRSIPLFWVNWFDSEIGTVVSVRRKSLVYNAGLFCCIAKWGGWVRHLLGITFTVVVGNFLEFPVFLSIWPRSKHSHHGARKQTFKVGSNKHRKVI